MKPLRRIAFIGNHLPRQCGIATFTHDLNQAVVAARPDLETWVVAMNDPGQEYEYPPVTRFEIRQEEIEDYIQAADFLNGSDIDLICLQHEFGIFGGESGSHILALLTRLNIPVVTTLHTVLADPTPVQRQTLDRIIDLSARVIVMSEKANGLVQSVHGVSPRKIEVIPHGIPDSPFRETYHAKMKLGLAGKMVILTFGLLSPNKGIETVIDAMPGIIQSCSDAIYIVVGATHPTLVREHGEAYRQSLVARARALGIENHVLFYNRFVDQETLLTFISACDVYVTPYLNEAQMTSGTLAYSFGLGSAIVSTPYWHAAELLAGDLGVLVPFGDSKAIATQVTGLLTNDVWRHSMRRRAYAASRSMTWPQAAKRYIAAFNAALDGYPIGRPAFSRWTEIGTKSRALLPARVDHLLSLCDDTGLLQHSTYNLPDRTHGYCIDDNARALLLACVLDELGEPRLPDEVTQRFAAFVHHAWNPENGRFRNFMGYDRQWLDEAGSEDSHGRTLWALGEYVRNPRNRAGRAWAAGLFRNALPAAGSFTTIRGWAFTLLGLDAWCMNGKPDAYALRMRSMLAGKLMAALRENETADWVWFEPVLAYDNARLPQALLHTGIATGSKALVDAGISTLEWLTAHQTAPAGHFRPVGTDSFGIARQPPRLFDQQPLEAAATISACSAAWRATHDPVWHDPATAAFRWFSGGNDLGVELVDSMTGGCADGLHPDRRNENMGAESAVSYLLGWADIRRMLMPVSAVEPVSSMPRLTVGA